MSGTKILTGEGKIVAIVVGDESCEGRVNKLLKEEQENNTPLQTKLQTIANDVGKVGLISAIVIVASLLVRLAVEKMINGEYGWSDIKEIIDFLIIGVTVLVVAIPEGLPLAVTLSLAFSIKRMLKDNNLVRKLQACETMGGANIICSDKTGTLTQNKMTLTSIWNQKNIIINANRTSFDLKEMFNSSGSVYGSSNDKNSRNDDIQELFLQSVVCNHSVQLGNGDKMKGNNTEISVLEFLKKAGLNIEKQQSSYKMVKKIPFNSFRKRMTVVLDIGSNKYRVLIKGGSELIVDLCSKLHRFDNKVQQIDENLNRLIEEQINRLCDDGLRTICYGYKDIEVDKYKEMISFGKNQNGVYAIEQEGFSLLGIFGIRDILRAEVPAAIRSCRKAGVEVKMITGDNKVTAQNIAIECGIIDRNNIGYDVVMEGAEFIRRIGGTSIQDWQEFDKIARNLKVLARSRPEDKYVLVNGLMQKGNVVAVTGDGSNDAPALKKADVGFAMGINGSQMAKQCAEIILLDDNFGSIVKAVMWGRNIYDNIRKFLQFQLTANIVAVFTTLVGAVILKQEILSAIQMLWINLIMDSLASVALATQSPSKQLLKRQPHSKNEYIVNPKMFKHIIGQSIYQIIVIMVVCFQGEHFLYEFKDDLDLYIQSKLSQSDPQYLGLGGLLMKYNNHELQTVRSGRYKTISDTSRLYPYFEKQYQGLDYIPIMQLLGPSRHFTILFNIFVWMTIFNFINARVINDRINPFKGIFTDRLFMAIVIMIMIIQILLVVFGGATFNCYYWGPYYGLHYIQWLYPLGFGIGGMLISLFLKFVPDPVFKLENNKQQLEIGSQLISNEIKPLLNRQSLISDMNYIQETK